MQPSQIETPIPELPGEDLRWRVAGTQKADWFWKSGGMSVANISTMLAIAGTTFADYRRSLEFGCGCGRILLHMKEIAEKSELYGVDIDGESVAWARQHVPWAKLSVNDGMPPLAFPDGHFDLVFNHSVFSHLDENYQDAWLEELMRVTKPGAALVLSVAGDDPFAGFVKSWRDVGADPAHLIEQFRTRGILFIENDGWVGGPFPDFYHSTFHAPWYVFEHWGRFFDVKAYVPRGSLNFQDYVLLRRRDEPLRAAMPQRGVVQAPEASHVAPPARKSFANRALGKLKKLARPTPK